MAPAQSIQVMGKNKTTGSLDLIIIDPPSRQRGSFDAEINYSTILKRIGNLANPNADIIATLNSPRLDSNFLLTQMAEHAPQYQFVDYLPASPEFDDLYPERSLKIYHFRQQQVHGL